MSPNRNSSAPLVLRKHPHLYEINTWAWLEALSLHAGRLVTLGEVPDAEIDAITQRGFNAVWLMGVWQRSAQSKLVALADPANIKLYDQALPGWRPEDVVGSPYAVTAYSPDRRIGKWDALDRFRQKLRARGIALFLDFVGNHTALDHPWTREHPEYYVQGSRADFEKNPAAFYAVETSHGAYFIARAKDPYFPPWKDAAQLNHFSPAGRAAQIANLKTIAAHCDGLRCDMAMLHLNDIFARLWGKYLVGTRLPSAEFWSEARSAVPDLILLAECYWGTQERLLNLGFSYAYDKELYDAVRNLNLNEVRARLAANPAYQSRLARFLENHDEDRRAVVFPNERLQSVGTLMATLPGMRFYYQGELEGLTNRLPITLSRAAPEPADPVSSAFFEKLLSLTNGNAFHSGEWGLLPVVPEGDATSNRLFVYEWRAGDLWKMVAANLSGEASQGRVRLGGRVSAAQDYVFFDQLNDVRYVRSGEELERLGLFVRLGGFQAHLFDITPA